MPIHTIKSLIESDIHIIEHYRNAVNLWNELRQSPEFENVEALASELSSKQMDFEQECGGRWPGQEIMAMVGIGQFYSIEVGFQDTLADAMKVKEAFAQSYCSLEVKWHAERAAKIYRLSENTDL